MDNGAIGKEIILLSYTVHMFHIDFFTMVYKNINKNDKNKLPWKTKIKRLGLQAVNSGHLKSTLMYPEQQFHKNALNIVQCNTQIKSWIFKKCIELHRNSTTEWNIYALLIYSVFTVFLLLILLFEGN